jgi:LmbE family N-acetylglucosaminyl deacetylase
VARTPRGAEDRAALQGRTVLAVFAHPDDESLACGGTLARLADAGARVVLLCASRGERGSLGGPARNDALGDARAREMFEAASALGLSGVVLLDHPDGDLRWARVSELHGDIVMAIRRFSPAAVITFGEDGLYWHEDHIAIHERTTTAVRVFGSDAPALYYVTMGRGVMRQIVDQAAARGWAPTPKGFWSVVPDAFGLHAAPASFVVDVTDWVDQKLAALRCHRTQLGADHPFDCIDDDQARRWLGTELFQRALDGASADSVLEAIGEPVRASNLEP